MRKKLPSDPGEDVWRNCVDVCECGEKHEWAFYYFMKRQGDDVYTTRNPDGTFNIHRKRINER